MKGLSASWTDRSARVHGQDVVSLVNDPSFLLGNSFPLPRPGLLRSNDVMTATKRSLKK